MTVNIANPGCLEGFTVGVTASRRAEELATLLTRRGATVVATPAIRIIPLADDTELERVTQQLVTDPPQITVATTGIGFRGWMEAAEGWGLAEDLRTTLGSTRLLARGPKAKGAIRAAELREEWSPASESSAEVLDHLLGEGVEGVRIAVQLHGATTEWEPVPDFCEVLRCAGADVVPVPVYRWIPPEDSAPMDRMIEAIVTSALDCVTFTSAPAVASTLMRAKETGLLEAALHAFRARVLPACVGPITAAPLEELGVSTTMPGRARLGALARHVAEELPRRANRIHAAGHILSVRGGCVVVDGRVRQLAPAPMALMRALARQPGRVVSREDLLAALPGGGDDTHAVETGIARLRAGLGTPKAVQTVVKRGYRLALDPAECIDNNPRPTGGYGPSLRRGDGPGGGVRTYEGDREAVGRTQRPQGPAPLAGVW
ncbi:uroporphyrinogen-III synthase [Nocardia sp. BMG51109]|uniref:uroporphyrinogen-III synthase n=1 Tax=Nocardia sp. BMG51109 TaxID=1056816 RepID=UPI0004B30BC9|nr:uroporphyrinogen-III synthase [Nocardia sp. BMG51109]